MNIQNQVDILKLNDLFEIYFVFSVSRDGSCWDYYLFWLCVFRELFFFFFVSIFFVILFVKNNGYFKCFFLYYDLIYILFVNKWIIFYINCWDYYCYLWWYSFLIKWMEYMYLLKVLMELKNFNNGFLIIWYII